MANRSIFDNEVGK